MSARSPMARAWKALAEKPGGRWIFSQAVARKAPYFKTIRPTYVDLRPGYCEARMPKRKAITNHIGTVHAIAMCNLAELVGGSVTDVSVPSDYRWIPKGMNVQYLRKAETDLRGVAKLEIPDLDGPTEVEVPVDVLDRSDQVVFHADITMWVTPKGPRREA